MELTIKSINPNSEIAHFVHSFWMLENNTSHDFLATLLPNAMVDLVVTKNNAGHWQTIVRGIDTAQSQVTIPNGALMFAVGLKLLAVEYLLGDSIKSVLNQGRLMEDPLWKFDQDDVASIENFAQKATHIIKSISSETVDNRKKKLFERIYDTNGSIMVKELSDTVNWSSRQINRYFNQQFGISLKAYCNILRFSSSFKPISEGNLYPEQNYTDQNHFIKEIKKYSGVTPKELSKNSSNQFIDLVAIKKLSS